MKTLELSRAWRQVLSLCLHQQPTDISESIPPAVCSSIKLFLWKFRKILEWNILLSAKNLQILLHMNLNHRHTRDMYYDQNILTYIRHEGMWGGKRGLESLIHNLGTRIMSADRSGRAVKDVDLWPVACWDCGFVSRRGHGCLLWVSWVVMLRSLRRADHSSRGVLPTVVCLTECEQENLNFRRPRPTRGVKWGQFLYPTGISSLITH